jgi:hypothetical protein
VIAIVAASTVVLSQSGHRTSTTNRPSPSQPSKPAIGTLDQAVDVGSGWPGEAVVTTDGLYVLTTTPSQVVLLNAAGTNIKATASVPMTDAVGIAVGDGRVWVWSQNPRVLYVYDATTLQRLGWYTTSGQIFAVTVVDGELYLTTDGGGLLRASAAQLPSGPLTTTKVAGIDGFTYGLAADPARHRVLVGVTPAGSPPANGFTGARVVAVDTRTGKVVAQSPQTSVGKESIAVVGDQVWIGGYGDTDKPRIEHLDARTLRAVGTSPVGSQVGPGAILWAGQDVLWVRDGGDEQLSCVDPSTGTILEQWTAVQGPVTSVAGHAYGVQTGVQPLTPLSGACTG